MNTKRCETCYWSAARTRAVGPVTECHRTSPGAGGWPVVRPTDLCGEYAWGGSKGLTASEKRHAAQSAVARDFFLRLAGVGRGKP